MSTLASQLAGIRSHNAERLASSGALTSRDSYLFTPRVAAEQDHLTVHALGLTGWDQLVEEDAHLAQWAHGDLLFGEQSIKMDRTTLPKHTNDEIDTAVREFLYLVGPVLLSRSVAKCLEWLVRRFRIHEYTPKALLHAFLPYHLTPQFARILQLVPLEKAEMPFLVPVKKAGMPLPTATLVQALASNMDVLRWMSFARAPPGVAHIRRMHVPFWTSTLIQFCLFRRANKRRHHDAQAVLSALVPDILYVAKGGMQDQEQAVGALMVLCSLSVAFPLSAKAVRGLLDAIVPLASAEAPPAVARALVAACMSLCASPEDVADPLAPEVSDALRLMSPAMIDGLVKLPELDAQLTRALDTHDIEPFIAQFVGALLAHPSEPTYNVLERVLDKDALPPSVAHRAYLCLLTAPANDRTWDARIRLLAHLRERHPHTLDSALAAARARDEGATWRVMRAVLHMQATGTVPMHDEHGTALWMGVHGADAHAQHMALVHLLEAVDQGGVRPNDSLVRNAIETALARGSAPLLDALYGHAQTVLSAMEPEALLDAITACMRAEHTKSRERHAHLAFVTQALLPHAPHLSVRVWREMMWSELMPRHGACSDAILSWRGDTPMAKAAISAARKAPKEPVHFVESVARAMVTYLASCDEETLFDECDFLCSVIASEPISYGGALALLVLSQLVAHTLPHRVWLALAYRVITVVHAQQLLAGQVDDVIVGRDVDDTLIHQVLAKLSRQSVRLLAVQLVYTVLEHIPTDIQASLFMEVQQRSTPLAQVVLHVFQTLHAPSVGPISAKLVPVLLERLGSNAFALLAGVWTTPGGNDASPPHEASLASLATVLEKGSLVPCSNVPVRLMAMRHATLLANAAARHRRALDAQTLLPSLLLVLQDTVPVLRDAAARLLCALDAWNMALAGGRDDRREVYGLDQVYGERSASLQYLDTPTYVKYTSMLAKEAEAFVNDTSFLASTHAAILRGSSKKEVIFRSKVLCYLLSHVVCTPDIHTRMALLAMVRDVHASCKLSTLLPLIREAVQGQVLDATYVHLLYEAYDASAVPVLEDGKTHAFAYLETSLRSDASQGLQEAALHAVSGVFGALGKQQQQEVFLALAETLADPQTTSVPSASAVLRTLPVSDSVLVAVLHSLCSTFEDEDEPSQKRARAKSSHNDQMRHAAIVLIAVLESMQSRTLGMGAALVAALFDVVRTAISLHATHLFNAEYVLQLAMQSLCNVFDHITVLPADVAQVIRADTIVNAIKVSTNTQSINHAILLLARFARLDAALVLHNIMPIFTFVGLNVLQRDDRFTLSVVEQTLRSIIPAFVNAVRPQVINDKDARLALWVETRSLLRIFSDASTHIPRHRRHVFFRLLVDVLGADDFLAPVCMLLADRVAHRVSKAPSNSSHLLQLALGLMRAEPFRVRVHAMNQIWAETLRLLHGSEDVFLAPAPRREYSDEHLSTLHQAHTLFLFLHDAMTHAAAHPDEVVGCENELAQYAWHTLCVTPPDEAIGDALHKARTPVFRLLPTRVFLTLILHLLHGTHTPPPGLEGDVPQAMSAADMQRTALELLAPRAPLTERQASLDALDALHVSLIRVYDEHAGSQLGEDAMSALHTSITHATPAEHDGLAKLMPSLLAQPPQPGVLHVLATTLAHVGVRALSHLAMLVPYACSAVETGSEDARTAGLHMLAALFKTLAQFMHAYVERIVRLLCDASGRDDGHVRNACRKVQDAMVKRMPPATVLEALVSVWRDVHGAQRISLLHMLQLTVKHMDKNAMSAHYKAVFRFILQAMDEQRAAPVHSDVVRSASRAVQVFVTLAMKLSETQFRPLFLRTYDWAVIDLLDEDSSGVEARSVALYALVNTLFEHLHSMMVPFYAVVYDNAVERLEQDTATPLWRQVVRSVRTCAECDEGTFWNAVRATKCVAPLVKAMPYDEDDVHDTLLALANAVPDDEFLRTLNTALMSAARSDDVSVQVQALSVCASLWAAHGMALLTFVPETVAALSELLDDADPRTSSAALKLRVHIEEALGESLDSYLDSTL